VAIFFPLSPTLDDSFFCPKHRLDRTLVWARCARVSALGQTPKLDSFFFSFFFTIEFSFVCIARHPHGLLFDASFFNYREKFST